MWGSTVNLASRMESTGVTDRIQVSQDVYDKISFLPGHEFKQKEIEVKGVGTCTTYIVTTKLDV